jgi:hypothetical protein
LDQIAWKADYVGDFVNLGACISKKPASLCRVHPHASFPQNAQAPFVDLVSLLF